MYKTLQVAGLLASIASAVQIAAESQWHYSNSDFPEVNEQAQEECPNLGTKTECKSCLDEYAGELTAKCKEKYPGGSHGSAE